MKLETILEKIKQNREQNKKLIDQNEKTKKYESFLQELDRIHENLNSLQGQIINVNKDDNQAGQNVDKGTSTDQPESDEKKTLFNTLSLIDSVYTNNFSNTGLTGWNNKLNTTSSNINDNPDMDESQKKYLLERERRVLTDEQIRQSLFSPSRPVPKIEKRKVNIDVEIDSITDLIKLTEDYPLAYDIEYNINMKAMHDIKAL